MSQEYEQETDAPSREEKKDTSSTIEADLVHAYVVQLRELRNQGKSWEEVGKIMGIWWPEYHIHSDNRYYKQVRDARLLPGTVV